MADQPADDTTDQDARNQALEVVVDIAFEWAQEYGFSDTVHAEKVWAAAVLLRPDREPPRS